MLWNGLGMNIVRYNNEQKEHKVYDWIITLYLIVESRIRFGFSFFLSQLFQLFQVWQQEFHENSKNTRLHYITKLIRVDGHI